MAGSHVVFSVEDEAVRQMLVRQAELPGSELMARIGEYLVTSTQARFKTQTAPDGTPWAPLKPSYKRRKKYNQDKVLTLRGYLRSGIRYQVEGQDTVRVGTNAVQGAIHQFGGPIQKPARTATVRYRSEAGRILFAGRKHANATVKQVNIPAHQIDMPARPYLGISAADDKEIREIISDWVIGQSK